MHSHARRPLSYKGRPHFHFGARLPLFLGHRYSSSTRYRYCWVHALDTAPSCMGEGGRTGGEWEGGKWRRRRLWVTGDAWEEQLESGRRATASGTRTSSPYQRRQALSDVFQHQSHINNPGFRAPMQQRLKASVCCLRHAAHVCGDITAEVLAALSIMSLSPHAAVSHITGQYRGYIRGMESLCACCLLGTIRPMRWS